MTQSANDEYFNILEQLRSLEGEQAIEFASRFIDEQCDHLDAEYLKQSIHAAGDEAVELARRYATAGSMAAQFVYGTGRLHGTHMEQNVAEGLFWLRRAHNNGSAKATIVLAGAYLQGRGVSIDAHKAARYAEAAAEKNDPAGQYLYASLLIEGLGVTQDEDSAILWLQRAAAAGHEPAVRLLTDNGLPLV